MKGEDGGPLLREAVETHGWRRRPGIEEAHRNQEQDCPVCTPLAPLPAPENSKLFVFVNLGTYLVTFVIPPSLTALSA